MAKQIFDLTSNPSPLSTDIVAVEPADGAGTYKQTVTALLALLPSATLTLTNAADDTAAASAGIAIGGLYRNGSVVMIRVA